MEAAIDEGGVVGCGAFFDADAESASLRRFLVGLDTAPQLMERAEIESELNDPLAALLFRQGVFPSTAEGVLAELDLKIGTDHPLSLSTQRSFVVGEGTQIAKDRSATFNRNIRFLVTRGRGGPDGPDLMISTFRPNSTSIEVMAWDPQNGGFNFYRTIPGAVGSWAWAGNSRHAWEEGTRSSGPFESHPTGNLLFKEFKLPWVHWHSSKAIIDKLDFPAADDIAEHSWFTAKENAYVLEDSVAKLAITRWNRTRLGQVLDAGAIEEPTQVMERIVGSPAPRRHTVNLVSSEDTQPALAGIEAVRLPKSFFVDVDGLSGVLDLPFPKEPFEVSADVYRSILSEFDVTVSSDDGGFSRPGDTHFLFVVPERAFEDTEFVRQLVKPDGGAGERDLGLVSERLVGCLLMVDFPNPVFSERRASLRRHLPAGPLPASEWGGFAETFGNAIAAAATGTNPEPAELEFAELWNLKDDGWRDAASQRLESYYAALAARLGSADDFKQIFMLAEARRNRVREMPINETSLLFAETSIPPEDIVGLAMNPDGTVEQRDSA